MEWKIVNYNIIIVVCYRGNSAAVLESVAVKREEMRETDPLMTFFQYL